MLRIRITPCILAVLFVPVTLFAQEMNLQKVLRQHRAAQAEVSRLLEADTLRLVGETSQQGVTYGFTLYKKSPNLLRYDIDYKTRHVAIIYDGNMGYYLYLDEPQRPAVMATRQQLLLLKQESYFEGPLISASERGFRMEYMGRVEIPDHDNAVYHIQLKEADGSAIMDVYLDAYSFLEVRRETRPNAEATPLVTRFSDFRDTEGFSIPYRIENFYNGTPVSTTRIKDVAIDVGILGYFFELPPGREAVAADELR